MRYETFAVFKIQKLWKIVLKTEEKNVERHLETGTLAFLEKSRFRTEEENAVKYFPQSLENLAFASLTHLFFLFLFFFTPGPRACFVSCEALESPQGIFAMVTLPATVHVKTTGWLSLATVSMRRAAETRRYITRSPLASTNWGSTWR